MTSRVRGQRADRQTGKKIVLPFFSFAVYIHVQSGDSCFSEKRFLFHFAKWLQVSSYPYDGRPPLFYR